jgi:oligopeptidase B
MQNMPKKILDKVRTEKLRSLKTDNNLLLLKTNMDSGHGGASGRYEYLKDIALEYTFLLTVF